MKADSRFQSYLRELRLPRDGRAAARAEAALRSERDNDETADRRAAALEAERRRATMHGGSGVGGL